MLPVFFMVLLGMFTGGLAYSRKSSVTEATREGARYGATLPLSAAATTDAWLQRLAAITVSSSDGELAPAESGAAVCVAYVPAAGPARRLQRVGGTDTFSDATCFSDGRTGETRVQVVGQRTSKLEVLVWSRDLTLVSRSVARFEAG